MLAPVALFVYNRPDHAKATLDALKRNVLASNTKLFVFSDGAKTKGESDSVEAVRKLVLEVVGFSSVTLVERHENMGLARSIISGVTELLDQFDKVIVLEDDLVTSRNFLAYMNDALSHYQYDQHAFSVTGHTFPEKFLRIPKGYAYDTYAGYRCSSWSWGTWRDRWQRIDWGMGYFPSFCKDHDAQHKFNRGGQDMTESLRMQYAEEIDSWAIRFCYAHYINEMRCIYPTKTLVRNIGLDCSGTHSTPNPRFQHLSLDDSWLPHRFSPANELSPIIAREFRAVFDPPRPSFLQSFFHEAKKFRHSVLLKTRGVKSTIRRFLIRPTLDVDVLVVNTHQKSGGAARAAYRMFCGIREAFPGVRYLTLFREDSAPDVFGLSGASVRGAIALCLVDRDRRPLSSYPEKSNSFFSPAVYPNPLRIRLSRFRPKLAHLHWVGHGLLRVEDIGKLNCPIIWTLHDAWAFTGGCHYTGVCESYKQQCGNCPQLGSMRPDDLSRALMLRKIRAFANLDLTIVAPSRWLGDMAAQSSLFFGRRIEVIPNGLDTEAFKPIDRNMARDYFGLSNDRPAILFGTHLLSDPRKGGDLLCEALASLGEECTLLIFGEGKLQLENAPLVTVRSLGSFSDNASLALAYSAADVFLCPSREDNLPNTVAEALACGTPCVAFDTNGLPDMIEHQKTGWLAKPFDPVDLASGIKWVLAHAHPEDLRKAARAKAVSDYSMAVMTERYSRLYTEVLESGSR
jgi:glycosyltransferase involved in cell wall biosynthesis